MRDALVGLLALGDIFVRDDDAAIVADGVIDQDRAAVVQHVDTSVGETARQRVARVGLRRCAGEYTVRGAQLQNFARMHARGDGARLQPIECRIARIADDDPSILVEDDKALRHAFERDRETLVRKFELLRLRAQGRLLVGELAELFAQRAHEKGRDHEGEQDRQNDSDSLNAPVGERDRLVDCDRDDEIAEGHGDEGDQARLPVEGADRLVDAAAGRERRVEGRGVRQRLSGIERNAVGMAREHAAVAREQRIAAPRHGRNRRVSVHECGWLEQRAHDANELALRADDRLREADDEFAGQIADAEHADAAAVIVSGRQRGGVGVARSVVAIFFAARCRELAALDIEDLDDIDGRTLLSGSGERAHGPRRGCGRAEGARRIGGKRGCGFVDREVDGPGRFLSLLGEDGREARDALPGVGEGVLPQPQHRQGADAGDRERCGRGDRENSLEARSEHVPPSSRKTAMATGRMSIKSCECLSLRKVTLREGLLVSATCPFRASD